MHAGRERVSDASGASCRLNPVICPDPTIIHPVADLVFGSWLLFGAISMQTFRRRGPWCGNDMAQMLQQERRSSRDETASNDAS